MSFKTLVIANRRRDLLDLQSVALPFMKTEIESITHHPDIIVLVKHIVLKSGAEIEFVHLEDGADKLLLLVADHILDYTVLQTYSEDWHKVSTLKAVTLMNMRENSDEMAVPSI